MRRGLILLLLILLLTGCSKSNPYLIVLENEIEVCVEECSHDASDFPSFNQIYEEITEGYRLSVAPNIYSTSKRLSLGETYNREDLILSDPISSNTLIPVYHAVSQYGIYMYQASAITRFCETGIDCVTLYVPQAEFLTDIDYGFNSTSGYYEFTAMKDENTVERYESLKFNFDGEFGSYEYTMYVPEDDVYDYQFFSDGIMYHYEHGNDKLFYDYININTREMIHVNVDGDDYTIVYHDPVDEITYLYNTDSNEYQLNKFEDFEFVARLILVDSYSLSLGFHFVGGWDKIEIRDEYLPDSSETLYYNDEVVFDDYNVLNYSSGIRYNQVTGSMDLSISEVDLYEFPNSYTGEMSFEVLKGKLDDFASMDNPLDIANLELNDVIDKINDILKNLEKKYN